MFETFVNRRAFLQAGAAGLTLPLLPSIARGIPSSEMAIGRTADGAAPKRLLTIFFPYGVSLPPEGHKDREDWHWFPLGGPGTDYRLTKSLDPLSEFRSDMSILSGLSHVNFRSGIPSHSTGDHYLNGVDQTHGYTTAITADQVYAATQANYTRFPSMVLSSNSGVGSPGKSHTLSFSQGGLPVPSLAEPHQIFSRMFGTSTDSRVEQARRLQADASILDSVMGSLKRVEQRMGREEKGKLDEYITSIRALEEQTKRSERWMDVAKPEVDPALFDLEADPAESTNAEPYIRTIYDLIHMAFQTDSTRVITYMINGENGGGHGNNFPATIGLKHHHGLSHGGQIDRDGYADWGQYDRWLSQQFAYLLTKLRDTKDPFGEGSLLDNTVILYGCGTSQVHTTKNFPTIVAGGKNMGLRHGRYHELAPISNELPFNNLLLTLLQTVGVQTNQFGDSDGTIDILRQA